jgi:hypothetical protein
MTEEKSLQPIEEGAPDVLSTFVRDSVGVERAADKAKELQGFVRANHLAVRIGRGEHLKIEAWQFLGTRCGVVARSRIVETFFEPIFGIRAQGSTFHMGSGKLVSSAEASCWADEVEKRKDGSTYNRWLDANGNARRHAIEGMAQTRANSRAYATLLRFIPILAGYSGTPAEEMPRDLPDEERDSSGRSPIDPSKALSFADEKIGGGGKHRDETWGEVIAAKWGPGWLEWVVKNTRAGTARQRAAESLRWIEARKAWEDEQRNRDQDAQDQEQAAEDERRASEEGGGDDLPF